MPNPILYQYRNGNTEITIHEDGTQITEWPDGEPLMAEFPTSADCKITNFCDLGKVCAYCHEKSSLEGKHGNLGLFLDVWKNQPGTELAIGGGNPLSHPDIDMFLKTLADRGIICNVTMNALHMPKFADRIKEYQTKKQLYGLGISYRGMKSMNSLPLNINYSNVVFHMILGVHSLRDCRDVIGWCRKNKIRPKILLLGYKTYGKGETFIENNLWLHSALEEWKTKSIQMLMKEHGLVISFDNLALSQLDMKNQIPADTWNLLYCGEDGNHTMYIDAVEQMVARTSTTKEKFGYSEVDTPKSLFDKVKVHHK